MTSFSSCTLWHMWGQLRRNVAGSVKLMALASRLKEAGEGTGAGAGATRVEGNVGLDGETLP